MIITERFYLIRLKILKRIERGRDYWNPKKLQAANIAYQEAKRNFKKNKWETAKKQYIHYIENRNKIDFDAYWELGICYYKIGLKENEKVQNKKSKNSDEEKKLKKIIEKHFVDSLKNFRTAQKYKPKKMDHVGDMSKPDFIVNIKNKRGHIETILVETKYGLNSTNIKKHV